MLEPRKIDSKGRVMLGSEYAGEMVLIERTEHGDIIIHPAILVPQKEAWVHTDPKIAASMNRALKQASKKQFSSDPIDLTGEDWLDND